MSKKLERRIKKLEDRVKALEDILANPVAPQLPSQPVTIPIERAPVGECPPGQCVYPTPWHAVIPPNCLKCGKQADQVIITCQSPGDKG